MITGKTILITGAGNIGGQLSEHLCQNNKVVLLGYGAGKYDGYYNITGLSEDVGEKRVIDEVFSEHLPDIVIHTAAMTNIPNSYRNPEAYLRANCIGTHNIIEAIKEYVPDSKLVYFSTAEIFGRNYSTYENNKVVHKSAPSEIDHFCFQYEDTALGAYNPYGASKLYCQSIVDMEVANGLKAISLICFNVEGPGRVGDFLSKKVIEYVGKLHAGQKLGKLKLGDITASRDWLHVEDCVSAVIHACCASDYGRYCVSSGETHTVEEFIKEAFESIGEDYKDHIEIDGALVRKVDRPNVRGKNNKMLNLGWAPRFNFSRLVSKLVDSEIDA